MKIRRTDLLNELTNRELPTLTTAELPAAALLLALAKIESNYQIDAVGDGGDAVGLWQVNRRTNKLGWPEGGAQATVPAQIYRASQVIDEHDDMVRWAIRDLKRRDLPLPPVEDVAIWYSVSWQWGPGRLRAWITTMDTHDPESFLRMPGVSEWYEENAPGGVDYFLRQRVEVFATELDWALKKMKQQGLVEAGTIDPGLGGRIKKKARDAVNRGRKALVPIAFAQGAGAIVMVLVLYFYFRGKNS